VAFYQRTSAANISSENMAQYLAWPSAAGINGESMKNM